MADQISITLSIEKSDELWHSFYKNCNVEIYSVEQYLREIFNDVNIVGYDWDYYANRMIIHFKTEQDKTWFALKWI
jgi:hypothetical protein